MPRMDRSDLLLLVLAAAYVVIPIDFIPELIAGPLGLTDDMAAVAVIVATFLRARRRDQDSLVSIETPAARR